MTQLIKNGPMLTQNLAFDFMTWRDVPQEYS